MDIKTILKSKISATTLAVLAIVVVALLVFAAGLEVGRRSAFFSCRWAQNYERNFGMPHGGMMPMRHGAFGEIISIDLPNIVVASPNVPEKTVVIGNDTVILRGNVASTADQLRVGDHIIVIGAPDDERGEIGAKLIRVLATVPTTPQPSNP